MTQILPHLSKRIRSLEKEPQTALGGSERAFRYHWDQGKPSSKKARSFSTPSSVRTTVLRAQPADSVYPVSGAFVACVISRMDIR